jgi:hypothetical protein
MDTQELKAFGPAGKRLHKSVLALDQAAKLAQIMSAQGLVCKNLANILNNLAKENHAAAKGVADALGYKVPDALDDGTQITPMFGQK